MYRLQCIPLRVEYRLYRYQVVYTIHIYPIWLLRLGCTRAHACQYRSARILLRTHKSIILERDTHIHTLTVHAHICKIHAVEVYTTIDFIYITREIVAMCVCTTTYTRVCDYWLVFRVVGPRAFTAVLRQLVDFDTHSGCHRRRRRHDYGRPDGQRTK